eukprot:TRINITY_DN6068_c0_g1_i1.p1 TRINITY_DN6068_c0_g1~~TRINITY_DN6068_c0_g1_i1.p1  ORF type:complete len:110 (-),score=11.49 TRINITY_DN6068_c0_g1_i1:49-378(-)
MSGHKQDAPLSFEEREELNHYGFDRVGEGLSDHCARVYLQIRRNRCLTGSLATTLVCKGYLHQWERCTLEKYLTKQENIRDSWKSRERQTYFDGFNRPNPNQAKKHDDL